jgi:hypothetical protein
MELQRNPREDLSTDSGESEDKSDKEDKPGLKRRKLTTSNDSDSEDKSDSDTAHKQDNERKPRDFEASTATEAEQKIAKLGRQPDGSKPVTVPKRVWRPKVKFQYEEPEDVLDTSDEFDWMFEDKGPVVAEPTQTLPPRDDLIKYDPSAHQAELDKNIQWRDCPEWCQPTVRKIIEEFFDVFAQEGMQRAIRGFEFQIDTGEIKPITCKVPVYGQHEERVIQELVKTLQDK